MEQSQADTAQQTHEERMLDASNEVNVVSDNQVINVGNATGTDTGTASGTQTGTDTGTLEIKGTETGTASGTETGTDSVTQGEKGTDSGTQTGTDSGTDKEELSLEDREKALEDREFELYEREVRDSVYAITGGEEQFRELQSWAKDNVDAESLELYNDMIEDGAPVALVNFMVNAMSLMRSNQNAATHGTPANLIHGDAQTANAPQGYSNDLEMLEAMSDPRYQRNDAIGEQYRQSVAQRMGITNQQGFGGLSIRSYG